MEKSWSDIICSLIGGLLGTFIQGFLLGLGFWLAESVLIRGIHASGGENERLERAAKWIRQEIVRLYAR